MIVEHEIDANSEALRAAFEDLLYRRGITHPWLLDDLMATVRRELLEVPREIVAEAGGLSEAETARVAPDLVCLEEPKQ